MEKRKPLTYGDLGIRKKTAHGTIRLAYGAPESKEVFVLREAPLKEEDGDRLAITRLRGKREQEVGHVEYRIMGREMQLRRLYTEPGHRRMDVASSLLAYLKTRGKDMTLLAGESAKPVYLKLGFEPYKIERKALKLPAEKPLTLRPWEKKTRKFAIIPVKR